jgi:hypothetical protein
MRADDARYIITNVAVTDTAGGHPRQWVLLSGDMVDLSAAEVAIIGARNLQGTHPLPEYPFRYRPSR